MASGTYTFRYIEADLPPGLRIDDYRRLRPKPRHSWLARLLGL